MGAGAGLALKTLQWFVRAVQFGSCAVVLALYSYFLATLSNHNLAVQQYVRAVEGISGLGVVYTAFGLLLLCCLAGHPFLSWLATLLDVLFAGAFVYVAVENKAGAGSCNGVVDTPYGTGDAATNVATGSGNSGFTALPNLHQACKMETACLAVSIAATVFFLISALLEHALMRNRRKENRFGPGPANNYTGGYGRRGGGGFLGGLFGRKKDPAAAAVADPNALPEHTHPGDLYPAASASAAAADHDTAPIAASAPHSKYESGYGYDAASSSNGYSGHSYSLGGKSHVPSAHYPPGNYRYDDGVYNA